MVLNFDVANDEYLDFIQDFRDKAKDPTRSSHGCPVLPLQKDVGGQEQHIDVNLRAECVDKGTLTIRRCDLRLVGYQKPGCSLLNITDFDLYDNSRLLDFERVPLYIRPSTIVEAVNLLADSKKDLTDSKEKDEVRSSLFVLRVLLCEAAKFHILSSVFDNVFKSGFEVPLHPWMLKLISDWEDLSKELLGEDHDDADDCNYYLADPDNIDWHCCKRRVIGVTCQDLARCLGILHGTLPTDDEEMLEEPIQGSLLAEIYSVLVYIDDGRPGCIYGTIKVWDASLLHNYTIYQRNPTECEFVESNDTLTLEGPSGLIDAFNAFAIEFDLKERDANLEVCKGTMYWGRNGYVDCKNDLVDTRHSVLIRGKHGYAVVFYIVYSRAVLATVEATLVLNNGLEAGISADGTNICVNGSLVARTDALTYSTEFEQKYYQTKLFSKVGANLRVPHECTPEMADECKLGKRVELGVPIPLSRSAVAVHADYSVTIHAALSNSVGDSLVTGSWVVKPQEAGICEGFIGQPSDSYLLRVKVSWRKWW